jgi:hypothetical protein
VEGDGPVAGGGQQAATDEKTTAALEACRAYMPNGGELTKPDPQRLEQARKFAQCMREHGITDFPDPDPNGHPGSLPFNPNDPKVRDAEEACKDLRPAGGPAR